MAGGHLGWVAKFATMIPIVWAICHIRLALNATILTHKILFLSRVFFPFPIPLRSMKSVVAAVLVAESPKALFVPFFHNVAKIRLPAMICPLVGAHSAGIQMVPTFTFPFLISLPSLIAALKMEPNPPILP